LDELIGKLEKHLQGSSGRHRARLVAKKWAWLVVIGGSRATKRVFDLVAGCLLLLASVPVFALLAAVIKLDSPGPVLFNQVRVGRNGVLFIMYKFRTMRTDAEKLKQELMEHNEAGGVIFKMKRDPRITRVGRILRKLSLDEPADRRRLEARPGLTCLWQVSGRSDIPFDGQVSLDVEYIETRSLWQDLVILVRTVPAVLLGKGAY
jgi:lipopolysaccharide/colanic/teichoic acid biosynthesis glycosyltransferase